MIDVKKTVDDVAHPNLMMTAALGIRHEGAAKPKRRPEFWIRRVQRLPSGRSNFIGQVKAGAILFC